MNFLGMGPMELMMILVLALIVFGPGKLPEIAGQVGRVVRDFRRTTSELSSEFSRTLSLEVEERKSTKASAATVEEAYEPPPAETVVGNADTATAGHEPAEAPPVQPVSVTTTSSNPSVETPASVAEAAPEPVPVAAASLNGVSKRRTRDTGIEPPY
jgi:TatA/E family protein of Tat protein translocase